jgi:hypothetical protein
MITAKDKKNEMNVLSLEIAEIKEISDIIFRRIENKIGMLNEMEASVDRKIAVLERLLQRAEYFSNVPAKAPSVVPTKVPANTPAQTNGMTRQQEVIALKQRGHKAGEIAGMLRMPVGEVEMILGLHLHA